MSPQRLSLILISQLYSLSNRYAWRLPSSWKSITLLCWTHRSIRYSQHLSALKTPSPHRTLFLWYAGWGQSSWHCALYLQCILPFHQCSSILIESNACSSNWPWWSPFRHPDLQTIPLLEPLLLHPLKTYSSSWISWTSCRLEFWHHCLWFL